MKIKQKMWRKNNVVNLNAFASQLFVENGTKSFMIFFFDLPERDYNHGGMFHFSLKRILLG